MVEILTNEEFEKMKAAGKILQHGAARLVGEGDVFEFDHGGHLTNRLPSAAAALKKRNRTNAATLSAR